MVLSLKEVKNEVVTFAPVTSVNLSINLCH